MTPSRYKIHDSFLECRTTGMPARIRRKRFEMKLTTWFQYSSDRCTTSNGTSIYKRQPLDQSVHAARTSLHILHTGYSMKQHAPDEFSEIYLVTHSLCILQIVIPRALGPKVPEIFLQINHTELIKRSRGVALQSIATGECVRTWNQILR